MIRFMSVQSGPVSQGQRALKQGSHKHELQVCIVDEALSRDWSLRGCHNHSLHQQKLATCLLLFIRSDLWCTGHMRKKDDDKTTQAQDM